MKTTANIVSTKTYIMGKDNNDMIMSNFGHGTFKSQCNEMASRFKASSYGLR